MTQKEVGNLAIARALESLARPHGRLCCFLGQNSSFDQRETGSLPATLSGADHYLKSIHVSVLQER